MKHKYLPGILLVALFAIALFSGCVFNTASNTAVGHVMFGKSGGSGTTSLTGDTSFVRSRCMGKGICKLSAQADPGFTKVTFSLKDENPMKLLLTFNLKTLSENQPDQSPLFTSPTRKYNFEAVYKLNDSIFEPLHLPANSRITPEDTTLVRIRDGQVELLVTFSHD